MISNKGAKVLIKVMKDNKLDISIPEEMIKEFKKKNEEFKKLSKELVRLRRKGND